MGAGNISEDGLPRGWVWTRLGEIGEVVTGTTPSKSRLEFYGKDYPFFKPSDLNDGYYVKKAEDGLSKQGIERARLLPPKSILITCIGATIGKTGFIRVAGASNQQINAIIPKKYVSPEFIYFMSVSPLFQKSIIDNASATTLPILNKSKFEILAFPFPPLPEQRAIASKIEQLFSDLDNGIENFKKAQAQLKRYRQAVLKYAFEGKLTAEWRTIHKSEIELTSLLIERIEDERKKNAKGKYKNVQHIDISKLPEGWVYGKLEHLIYIAGRIGWRGLKAEEYTDDGPLFLSVYNLNKGDHVDFSEVYHISVERYDESPEIQLKNDDILLVKDGAGIGKLGIVKGLKTKGTVNSSLLVIRSGKFFVPEYLFYFLKGPNMQIVVKERITGSATPHLFQRDIKKFELLIPPIGEQEKIVCEIETRLSVCDKMEATITESLQKAESLRQSILKKAFEGKLLSEKELDETRNAPDWEPAEKLLQRIKDEKMRIGEKKKKR